MLRYMRPASAADSPADCGLSDTILISQGNLLHATSGIAVANFLHLLVGKFRRVAPFTASHPFRVLARTTSLTARLAPFGNHVRVVVGYGAKKQMGGVAAPGRVACVQDPHSFRDGTVFQYVGEAVCSTLDKAMNAALAIAVAVASSLPQPTSPRAAGAINPGPISHISGTARPVRGCRAAFAAIGLLASLNGEWLFAVGTDKTILGVHRNLQSSAANPRPSSAARGLSVTSDYTKFLGIAPKITQREVAA